MRGAAESLDASMRNAAGAGAARVPGLGASPRTSRKGTGAGASGGAGVVASLLALLVEAVRRLAEVTAVAVSMFLASVSQG